MKILRSKVRIWFAVALFSIALVCVVYGAANLTPQQEADKNLCGGYYQQCTDACGKWTGKAAEHLDVCFDGCTEDYNECLKRHGVPLSIKPPLPTPTPRKGPGQISPPPKSHPTPTPRKGPGKVGTTGIGKASPTPSPKGPVLLEKSGKPSPTPRPSPKETRKSDHH